MNEKALTLAMVFATVLSVSSSAKASSGTVTGTLLFYQNNGNYCDVDTVDCTGTKYPESQFNKDRPIKNVKVYARRSSDNQVIGSGFTNTSGSFSFTWTDNDATGNVAGQIIWRGEHRDDRFRLATTSDGYWIMWSNATFLNGQTTPKGNMYWGSSGSPHALSNVYDGASKLWENSLSQSNRMNNYFSDLKIRAWDTSTSHNDDSNIVSIQSSSAYANHGSIMHEMGHAASDFASRDQDRDACNDYCYPSTGSGCSWGRHAQEWACSRFEEAIATHFATVGLYSPTAVEPFYCPSSSPCTSAIDNLETEPTSCTAADARHPHDLMRYFWDTYDSSFDRGVWEIVDTVHAFDNGTGERDKNEPWNSSMSSLNERDGRSGTDFVALWDDFGTDSFILLSDNCGDTGDL